MHPLLNQWRLRAFCVGTTNRSTARAAPSHSQGFTQSSKASTYTSRTREFQNVRGVASTTLGVLDNFAKREALKAKMKFAFSSMALPDLRDFFPHLPDTYDPTSSQTEAEMVANILFFNVMGQDDASGKFTLDNDKLKLDWDKKIGDTPIFGKIETLLKSLSESMGGSYVPFPFWKGLGNKKLTVNHPLGGCPIAPTSLMEW